MIALALFCLLAPAALAEDVTGKWRFSLSGGGYNAQDEVESNSANVLVLLNKCLRSNTCVEGTEFLIAAFQDPRDDSTAFGNLDLQAANIGTLAVQYGLAKSNAATFVVEGSIGYQKGDVGDLQVAVQFTGDGPTVDELDFNFSTFKVAAGELTRVPIQFTALARFRPRAKFNPYIGAGIGYSLVGFDASDGLNALSQNMDASRGVQMRLTNVLLGGASTTTDGRPLEDLDGAVINAQDSFEWHLAGGLELTLKRRWSIFMDVRWVDASRGFSIGFNGGEELGVSVPQFTDFEDSPRAKERYGPVLIGTCPKNGPCTGGGLVDVGQVVTVPQDGVDPGTNCATSPNLCEIDFIFTPDGVPDAGQYYVQGGTVDYDGFSLQFGARFTF